MWNKILEQVPLIVVTVILTFIACVCVLNIYTPKCEHESPSGDFTITVK